MSELEIITKPSTDIVDGTRFVTSINTDTPEGAIEIFNALSDAEDIRDYLGEVLEIVNFAAEPAEFEEMGRSGRVSEPFLLPRMVRLCSPGPTSWFAHSIVCSGSLGLPIHGKSR